MAKTKKKGQSKAVAHQKQRQSKVKRTKGEPKVKRTKGEPKVKRTKGEKKKREIDVDNDLWRDCPYPHLVCPFDGLDILNEEGICVCGYMYEPSDVDYKEDEYDKEE